MARPIRVRGECPRCGEVVETDADVVSAIGVIEHLRDPHELFAAFGRSRASVLYCYSLGKAQRILAGVDASIGPIVCHGARPKRMFAILHAASVTIPMMKQLKKRPRYTARNPRTTDADRSLYPSAPKQQPTTTNITTNFIAHLP